MSDNLNSIVVKILGQKNETTTKSNYQNASLAAKLNYLETEIGNLKTKVEISGGVPRCVEYGTLAPNETKTFTGPGVLYVSDYERTHNTIVDGVAVASVLHKTVQSAWSSYRIPFQDQCTISINDTGFSTPSHYAYYKY